MPFPRARARRELGQNFLVDTAVTSQIVELLGLVQPTRIIELGAGNGALTRELAATGHLVTAVEIDPVWAASVRSRCPGVRVIRCDMREFRFPRADHAVVGNLPYGITTIMTRRLLAEPAWSRAVLLVQWEVARKRALGGTMLNAQWSPWYGFEFCGRVGARSFQPVPSVDGGLLRIQRYSRPLLPVRDIERYQRFVAAVFTGRGRGVAGILRQLTGHRVRSVPPELLPRDLTPANWVDLYSRFGR